MKRWWNQTRWQALAVLFMEAREPVLWALSVGVLIAIASTPTLILVNLYMPGCGC